MHRKIAWLALLMLTVIPLRAGQLVSGPMLGYVEHREAAVIVDVANAKEVAIEFGIEGDAATPRRIVQKDPWESPAQTQPVRFVLNNLEPGQHYTYRVFIDGVEAKRPWPLGFTTQDQFEWKHDPANFSFLVGSCSYINDPPWDRPGTPYGHGTQIFRHMAESGANFMFWLGDVLYLRESDWWSASGIWHRWSKDRSAEDLQPLFASMSNYMIWDDHDYGPNNSSRSFPLKDVSLKAFKAYSGNKTYGESDNPGVYGTLQYQDAIFILLDNRYYRDDANLDQDLNPGKSEYGPKQWTWLLDTLAHLKENNNKRFLKFVFILTGSQFFSSHDYVGNEDGIRYRNEREKLLQFIRDEEIPGVIFLTGDTHWTELRKNDGVFAYPAYELTSSAYTSGRQIKMLKDDPALVPGTLFEDNNYCKVAISGPVKDRVATISCYDRDNNLKWTHEIRASDLTIPGDAAK